MTVAENTYHYPPLLGFVAYSGTGKTTLIEQVIPLLRKHNVRVGLIKHAHHQFDIDIPGKDSYRLRQAGAEQVLIASRKRKALIIENFSNQPEPDLAQCIQNLQIDNLDIILVEGFKHEKFTKIELHRESATTKDNKTWLYEHDPDIIAVATDTLLPSHTPLKQLDINNPEDVAKFVLDFIGQHKPE